MAVKRKKPQLLAPGQHKLHVTGVEAREVEGPGTRYLITTLKGEVAGQPVQLVDAAIERPAKKKPKRDREGQTFERGVGWTCDECGEVARKGTRCWETGALH